MPKFVIVPANSKKGLKKYVVDALPSKGNGVPLNPDANALDVQYMLPDEEQLKAGLPHYYKYYKENCLVMFWVQSLPGNLHGLKKLPVRVDILNKKGDTVNQLYCYLKEDEPK